MSYTLTIKFNPVVPAPPLGYRIKYWESQNPSKVTTVISKTSTLTVPGLTEQYYSGSVEPICGPDVFGAEQTFDATVTGGSGIVNASAMFISCVLGGQADHLNGAVTMNPAPLLDTSFRIDVKYRLPEESCSTSNMMAFLSGVMPAGQNFATVEGCPSGATYPVGCQVCSATVVVVP